MLTAIFDTETTGKWRKDVPATDPTQPHLVQLSCKLVDGLGRLYSRFTRLIKPTGWTIEAEAREVHGIDERMCHVAGVELWFALTEFQQTISLAQHIVAFNMQFDRNMITASNHRAGSDGAYWRKRAPDLIDVMERATPIVGLPGPIPGEFKWPSLDEAAAYFGIERREHDAEHDTDVTQEIFERIVAIENEQEVAM